MFEDLDYIKDLSTDELTKIISNILGFEETDEALFQLEKREPQKALELGIEILEEDKGDDYLQASVWDIIFRLNPEQVLNAVSRRTQSLGKELLYDMLRELNRGFYIKYTRHLPETIIHKILRAYAALPEDIDENTKNEIEQEFTVFLEKVKG